MKISFIIPMYNCENYIEDCIKSILNIEYKDYEILVVNDGSTDNSQLIIDKYEKKHKQIKSFIKINEGLSLTRNYGIKEATGDYIFFVDADDMIVPDEVDNIIKICNENRYDIIVATYKFYYNGQIVEAPFDLENNSKNNLEFFYTLKNLTAEAIKFIVKKDFLIKKNIEFKPNLLHEDELYMVELLSQVNKDKIAIENRSFYLYRKHNDSITTTKNPKRNYDMLSIANELYKSDLINKENKEFIIKRANLLFISAASSYSSYTKSVRIQLKSRLKFTFPYFKLNTQNTKDKFAHHIISIFGFYIFGIIQNWRYKKGRCE